MRSNLRPPLTARFRHGHWVALDWLVAALTALALGTLRHKVSYFPATWEYRMAAMALVVAPAMGLRRRYPLTALGVLLVFATPGLIVPLAFVLYHVAATTGRHLAFGALAVTLARFAVVFVWPRQAETNSIIAALICVTAWAIGYAVGQHRSYTSAIREQQAQRAKTTLERAQHSRTEERLRIARELHDVVGHSMSVVAVQAALGNLVIDTRPAEARAALSAIETTSRQALTEIRRLLGALRQEGRGPVGFDNASLPPTAGVADLDKLVTRTADTGIRVDLHVTGDRRDLPAGIDLTAYRIIQEALTNVVRHAAASSSQITLDYRHNEISIEVTDDGQGGTAVGDGHGITGMRERVNLYRGHFSAAPLPGHGFRVAATLPLDGSTS